MALDAPIQSKAVIGPNAVLQTEAALVEAGGRNLAEQVFAAAGLSHLLTDRPGAMIDEALPKALFAALFATLPRDEAVHIAHRAGELTGAYILRNRIPRPVRMLLRLLPARIAAPLLLKAIHRHAWTFAGSGVCSVRPGAPARIEIENNPLAMPGCAWHVGVFEVLFASLVSPAARIGHDHGPKLAGAPCRFEVAF